MGLLGLLVPEEYGGLGAGILDLAIFMEENARAGVFVPPLTHYGATGLFPVSIRKAMIENTIAMQEVSETKR